jgi:hypothetical protein
MYVGYINHHRVFSINAKNRIEEAQEDLKFSEFPEL